MKTTITTIQTILLLVISFLLAVPALKKWNIYPSSLDILMAVFLILMNYWWIQAMKNLTEEGQGQYWRIVFWSKLAAGRDCFTDQGWNYWLRLRYSIMILVLLIIGRSMV